MSDWIEVGFALGPLAADAAEEACWAEGAQSVTFVDAQDEPVLEPAPGEFRLWRDTRLRALFRAGDPAQAAGLAARLSARLGMPVDALVLERVADRAWEREWLRHYHGMRFGERLWIGPGHEDPPADIEAVVRLDPGLAFGTGTHPSTALCLEWLACNPPHAARVIDYGCGSGVLAIAAVKLGAVAAQCFDIDPQALLATADNATRNGVTEHITVRANAAALGDCDLLLANILAGPLCELAPTFAALVRPGGRLVLAGVLEPEEPEVTRSCKACFDIEVCGRREGWVCLAGRRRS